MKLPGDSGISGSYYNSSFYFFINKNNPYTNDSVLDILYNIQTVICIVQENRWKDAALYYQQSGY